MPASKKQKNSVSPDQLSLFSPLAEEVEVVDIEETETPEGKVIDFAETLKSKQEENDYDTVQSKDTLETFSNKEYKIKCSEVELKEVSEKSLEDLFSGFNTLQAITFSCDMGFINKIIRYFDYAEILIGAPFIAEKKYADVQIFAQMQGVGKRIRDSKELTKKIDDGALIFKMPTRYGMVDHRKVYILSADDGRTRVIHTSANLSYNAFGGNQGEFYDCDNTEKAFEVNKSDFDAAWKFAREIPHKAIYVNKADEGDPIADNVVCQVIKQANTVLAIQEQKEPDIEVTRYLLEAEENKEIYKKIIPTIKPEEEGYVLINANHIKKMEQKIKVERAREAIEIKTSMLQYPSLNLNIYKKEAQFNDAPLNLNPNEDEVKNDIDALLEMFHNFDEFVGDTEKLKRAHFKLMNAVFSSPFNSKLRGLLYNTDIPTTSLPLYLLISSSTANCGKSFVMKVILKMMTGIENLTVYGTSDMKTEDIKKLPSNICGTPVFVDEISNRYMTTITPTIKMVDELDKVLALHPELGTPMLIFASNDVLDPTEVQRKRMIFIPFYGALPSTIDQNAKKAKGKKLLKKFGTGFYREYLKRMLDKVEEEVSYILGDEEKPEGYYPDLMKKSSQTIIEILQDFGYDVPSYISELTWNDDYSVNANSMIMDALNEIYDFCDTQKDMVSIKGDSVVIEVGPNDKNKCKSWRNIMPAEMMPKTIQGKDSYKLTFKKKEFEDRVGKKIKKGLFSRKG